MVTIAKAVSGAAINVAFNAGIAFYLSSKIEEKNSKEVTSIVLVDTVMRIALAHLLQLKSNPRQAGTLGHLVFGCLTFCTQPLSVEIVRRYNRSQTSSEKSQTSPEKPKAPYTSMKHLMLMGYIFFAWKANIMAKDAIHLCFPSLFGRISF